VRGEAVLRFVRVVVEHLTNASETTELAVTLEDLFELGRRKISKPDES
jgi:hypothetical protein